MSPLFTFVVAACGDAELIRRTVNSILNQTNGNFEIICVCEDSADSSLQILARCKQRDPRIRIVEAVPSKHEQNSIITGLSLAQGDYLLLPDAGDCYDSNLLDSLEHTIQQHAASVVVFDSNSPEIIPRDTSKNANRLDALFSKLQNRSFCRDDIPNDLFTFTDLSPRTKCFSRDLAQSINAMFEERGYQNGLVTTLASLALAKSIVWIRKPLISLGSVPASTMVASTDAVDTSFIESYHKLREILEQNGLFEEVRSTYIDAFLSTAAKTLSHSDREGRERILLALQDQNVNSVSVFDQPLDTYLCPDDFYYVHGLILGSQWRQKYDTLLAREDAYSVTRKRTNEEPVKVSVIIPVYNVETYVGECLESIVNQTLHELEIICVIDGSTDKSSEIVHQYAQRDSRITVIEQENLGLSVARNHGLLEASGTYIYFMDSDDALKADALNELVRFADAHHLDNVFFDADCFGELGEQDATTFGKGHYHRKGMYPAVTTGMNLMGLMRNNREFSPSVMIQLNRLSHLKQHSLSFHRGVIHEDNAFTILNMACSERSGYINKTFFKRRWHADSIMTRRPSFDNAFGYYAAYLDVNNKLNELVLNPNRNIKPLIDSALRMLKSAREVQASLRRDEQKIYLSFEPSELYRYQADVADPAEWKSGQDVRQKKLRAAYREKQERGERIKDLIKKIDELECRNAKADRMIETLESEMKWQQEHLIRGLVANIKRRRK